MIDVIVSRRDQRGYAVSVIMLGVVAALILVAGLVIDGGQKATAASRAETVAAGAARAAVNAGVTGTLAGDADPSLSSRQARAAAQDYLAAADGTGRLRGWVDISGDRVIVRTEVTVDTIFLSIITIDQLHAHGEATARLVATR